MTRSDEELFTVFCAGSDQGQHMIAGYRALYEKGLSDAAPRWIAVTERLPDGVYCVLVTDGDESLVALWNHEDWDYGSGPSLDNVTHWMPLPELPESTNE
jgi:hypothetical protein